MRLGTMADRRPNERQKQRAARGQEGTMNRVMVRASSLLLVVAVASLAACATAPPPLPPAVTLQPGDVKSLAGEWEGTVTGSRSGTFDGPRLGGTVSFKEDGTFTSNLSGQPGMGTYRIVDGKVVYEGANMRGTATLHGSGKEQVLKGAGTWVGSTGQSSIEMRRR
jgi:hypothetical protein